MSNITTSIAVRNEIAERSRANEKRLDQAKAQIDAAVADLAAMLTAYSAIFTELNAAAAANPDDPAWQLEKAERDALVQDFNALKARADALKTAVAE